MTGEVGTARSPLGGAGWGDPVTVRIAEVPFTIAFDLRLAPAEAGVRVGAAVGATGWPLRVGETVPAPPGRRILCLGPDWWLLTGAPGDADLGAAIRAGLAGLPPGAAGSTVDVSANRTRIDVTGPRWPDVLRHVWARDLDAMTPGRCAQGLLGRAQALLVREDHDRVAVHVRASFARYAFDVLTDAAVEYR